MAEFNKAYVPYYANPKTRAIRGPKNQKERLDKKKQVVLSWEELIKRYKCTGRNKYQHSTFDLVVKFTNYGIILTLSINVEKEHREFIDFGLFQTEVDAMLALHSKIIELEERIRY